MEGNTQEKEEDSESDSDDEHGRGRFRQERTTFSKPIRTRKPAEIPAALGE